MNLVNTTAGSTSLHFSSAAGFFRRPCYLPLPPPLPRRVFLVRSSVHPFPAHEAKYHRELESAVEIVERACRICVDVQSSVSSSKGSSVEKSDSTPVTIADFGVQAFISYELDQAFPAIPLVAEEDSGFLRANNLVDSVASVIANRTSSDKPLTQAQLLEAIDRGGSNPIVYDDKPATYWILDPIDGTKGFLRGSGALYVVGLALVVEGEIVLGVMGCPNWHNSESFESSVTGSISTTSSLSTTVMVMAAHVGCGTWKRKFEDVQTISAANASNDWSRCSVDAHSSISEARFCITDNATWDSLPLSPFLGSKDVILLKACCGSLSRYIMVALGIASVFILREKPRISTKVSDWRGTELNLAEDKVERRILYPAVGVLVTNGKIHNHIVELISASPRP
ncbi:Putative PAP-specific phosphatase, mitochondrial [Linum grandiflorum]